MPEEPPFRGGPLLQATTICTIQDATYRRRSSGRARGGGDTRPKASCLESAHDKQLGSLRRSSCSYQRPIIDPSNATTYTPTSNRRQLTTCDLYGHRCGRKRSQHVHDSYPTNQHPPPPSLRFFLHVAFISTRHEQLTSTTKISCINNHRIQGSYKGRLTECERCAVIQPRHMTCKCEGLS